MKTYLLTIQTVELKTWETFKKKYRSKGLGHNINQAIIKLIERSNNEN